ncbi:hypothetical protein D3C80_1831820 [compost metagenome]
MQANEEVVFCDQSTKGFILLTLGAQTAEARLVQVSTILAKPFEVEVTKRFRLDLNGGLTDDTALATT